MTTTLQEALAAAEALPEDVQNNVADLISRQIIDYKLAASEASLVQSAAIPAETVFDRLLQKYAA